MSFRHGLRETYERPWNNSNAHNSAEVLAEEPLPSYGRPSLPHHSASEPRRRQSHVFSLEDAEGYPWATLQLASMAPSNKSLPVYFEGQNITGEARLDFPKPEGIKSVTILVSRTEVVNYAVFVFF